MAQRDWNPARPRRTRRRVPPVAWSGEWIDLTRMQRCDEPPTIAQALDAAPGVIADHRPSNDDEGRR